MTVYKWESSIAILAQKTQTPSQNSHIWNFWNNKWKGFERGKHKDHDNMHPRILKAILKHIGESLQYIFNQNLATLDIPQDWKLTKIKSIHKNEHVHVITDPLVSPQKYDKPWK